MEVVPGQVLAGKYKIERVLGRGGMGLVVAATHLQLRERVALKFLLPEALDNPEVVARFQREARAAVRIKSEHVARVSDVGTLENGAPYMVMEYLEGVDLSRWLAQRGVLPSEQAVEFVLQACEAISEAHTLGIVHRDIKPANLFVIERPDGSLAVKVLDFGISKSTGLGKTEGGMTKTVGALGSPLYMSPEQMQSAKDVDPRGDIWALGVVLYELVSGRTPFPGETMAEVVLKVVTGAPILLRTVCPQVSPGLEAVVLKCLEKDRAARYANVAELAAALAEFAPRSSRTSVQRIGRLMQRAGMSGSSAPPPPPPSSDPVELQRATSALSGTVTVELGSRTMAAWGQTHLPGSQRRRAVLVAAGLTVSVAVLGAIAYVRSTASAPATASSTAPADARVVVPAAAEAQMAGKSLVVPGGAAPGVTPRGTAATDAPAAGHSGSGSIEVTPVTATDEARTPESHTGAVTATPTAMHTATPAAVHTATPTAVHTATPAAVHTAPAPSGGKNPLKMSIQ
jgi:serine/threonine-protein kinase